MTECRMMTGRVLEIRKQLQKFGEEVDKFASTALVWVNELKRINVSLDLLRETRIAFTLDKVRKEARDEKLRRKCKELLRSWKKLEENGGKEKESSNRKVERGPNRDEKGRLVFLDFPDFKPNLTPKEVLRLGSFGGSYFRPHYSSVTKQEYQQEAWKELPLSWLGGLNISKLVASSVHDPLMNKYKIRELSFLNEEKDGFVHEQDPYGWFQWYCRFYQGRRSGDDQRQVNRWLQNAGPKSRSREQLVWDCKRDRCSFDDLRVKPVLRQSLQHWGYVLTKKDFEEDDAGFRVRDKIKGLRWARRKRGAKATILKLTVA